MQVIRKMNINTILIVIFFICSVIVSVSDIQTFHISLAANYIGLFLCIITLLISSILGKSYNSFLNHFLGAVCLFLVFLLVRIIAHKGIGWGDLQYSLFCGFISGIPSFIIASLLSAILGIICFFIIRVIKKRSVQALRIPFTPFMFIGTTITYFIHITII